MDDRDRGQQGGGMEEPKGGNMPKPGEKKPTQGEGMGEDQGENQGQNPAQGGERKSA